MAIDYAQCAACPVTPDRRVCHTEDGEGPAWCPTLEGSDALARAADQYRDPWTGEFALRASIQEAAGYANRGTPHRRPAKTRIEEICDFARRMGYRRLGLAFCAGLHREATLVHGILAAQGFEVVSVVCKVGRVPKEDVGVQDKDKICPGQPEAMCNTIAQAELLHEAGTELNILLGLCVGHDSLFFRHSKAPVTVLAAKDRVTAHCPLAAVYTSGSYYSSLLASKGAAK
jgi:uncharacterized metal-binding protein